MPNITTIHGILAAQCLFKVDCKCLRLTLHYKYSKAWLCRWGKGVYIWRNLLLKCYHLIWHKTAASFRLLQSLLSIFLRDLYQKYPNIKMRKNIRRPIQMKFFSSNQKQILVIKFETRPNRPSGFKIGAKWRA